MGLHQRLGTVVLAASLLAGCSRHATPDTTAAATPPKAPESVALVGENERSRHFMAVSRQLELGGTVYGYFDIDGDALKAGDYLHSILQTMVPAADPKLKLILDQDFRGLIEIAGFNDIKAVGFSSVPDGTGFFRNRAFFYTPNGRTGLLAAFGGDNVKLAHVRQVPANLDYYAETDVDLPAVYETVLKLSEKIGGDTAKNAVGAAVQTASDKSKIAFLELINGLKGHVSIGIRFDGDSEQIIPTPALPVRIPATSFIVRIDGIAQAMAPALDQAFDKETEGTRTIYRLKPELRKGPFPEFQFVVDGGALTIVSSSGFLQDCTNPKESLADSAAFKEALAKVGGEGDAVSYITPHFSRRLHAFPAMNPDLPAQAKGSFNFVISQVPLVDRPQVVVRTNLPDGILVRSYEPRSVKHAVLAASQANPIVLGMVAAMAIPAYERVQTNAADKKVQQNLAMISAAAEKYFEATGKTTVRYDSLVAGNYLGDVTPVEGENYHAMIIAKGRVLFLRKPNGQVVSYRPVP